MKRKGKMNKKKENTKWRRQRNSERSKTWQIKRLEGKQEMEAEGKHLVS